MAAPYGCESARSTSNEKRAGVVLAGCRFKLSHCASKLWMLLTNASDEVGNGVWLIELQRELDGAN